MTKDEKYNKSIISKDLELIVVVHKNYYWLMNF